MADRHAGAGQMNGRGQHLAQRQPAQAPVDVQVAAQRAGRRHRPQADVENLLAGGKAHRHRQKMRFQSASRQALARCVHEEIEQRRLALGSARQ